MTRRVEIELDDAVAAHAEANPQVVSRAVSDAMRADLTRRAADARRLRESAARRGLVSTAEMRARVRAALS